MDLPSVSVVVPAYNAQQTISHAIQSLVSQSYTGDIEILIVDDGSTDKTQQIVRSFREVRYVRQENAGPAAARNRGASDSKGEIILFTDSDCIPHRDWVEKIVGGFSSDGTGAVCGSYGIANPENILARCIHQEIMFRHRFLMPSYPKAFGSYNVAVRRAVFFGVGGFDETYRRASGEDNDLSYRIIKSGRCIFFVKDALVDHYHTTRAGKYLSEQFRHGFWRAKMYFDHPGMARGDDYTFWKDIVEVPLVGFSCVVFLFALAGLTSLGFLFLFIIIPFLVFEIYFASVMCGGINSNFYFGFIMFFRAFARCFGLSTGIFNFMIIKIKKREEKKPK